MSGGECSAIGAALGATPMPNVLLIEVAVGRVPEGGDVQRSAGIILRGGWCLWHRRDSHRLAPLEFHVNDQKCALSRLVRNVPFLNSLEMYPWWMMAVGAVETVL